MFLKFLIIKKSKFEIYQYRYKFNDEVHNKKREEQLIVVGIKDPPFKGA